MATDCYCPKCGSKLTCEACRAGLDDSHTLGKLLCLVCGATYDAREAVMKRIGDRPYSIAEFNSIAEEIFR